MQSIESHRHRSIRRRNNAGQRDRRFLRLAGPLSKLLKAGKPAGVSTQSPVDRVEISDRFVIYIRRTRRKYAATVRPLSLSLSLSLALPAAEPKARTHGRWLSASEETFLEMQIGSARRHSRRHGRPS